MNRYDVWNVLDSKKLLWFPRKVALDSRARVGEGQRGIGPGSLWERGVGLGQGHCGRGAGLDDGGGCLRLLAHCSLPRGDTALAIYEKIIQKENKVEKYSDSDVLVTASVNTIVSATEYATVNYESASRA